MLPRLSPLSRTSLLPSPSLTILCRVHLVQESCPRPVRLHLLSAPVRLLRSPAGYHPRGVSVPLTSRTLTDGETRFAEGG